MVIPASQNPQIGTGLSIETYFPDSLSEKRSETLLFFASILFQMLPIVPGFFSYNRFPAVDVFAQNSN